MNNTMPVEAEQSIVDAFLSQLSNYLDNYEKAIVHYHDLLSVYRDKLNDLLPFEVKKAEKPLSDSAVNSKSNDLRDRLEVYLRRINGLNVTATEKNNDLDVINSQLFKII